MTKKIQWEEVFDRVLSKTNMGRKAIVSDFSDSYRTVKVLKDEELISSLENGIGKISSNANELKEAYERLRKEYPGFMGKPGLSASDKE